MSSECHCSQFMTTSTTVECYSQDTRNPQDTTLISPTVTVPSPAHNTAFSSMARTEQEVASPDTGQQQCTRLSAADAWSTACCQLKLYQQRNMVRRNLWMRTAVNMVLLKPRPIWRAKYTKRPHKIPSVENVVDNASKVKPVKTQNVHT